MKPSLAVIKNKMGQGRAPSKNIVAKEIQRLINDIKEQEARAKVNALLWVFTGQDSNDAAIDLVDLTLGTPNARHHPPLA